MKNPFSENVRDFIRKGDCAILYILLQRAWRCMIYFSDKNWKTSCTQSERPNRFLRFMKSNAVFAAGLGLLLKIMTDILNY